MKKILLFVSLAVGSFVSCSREVVVPGPDGEKDVVHLNVDVVSPSAMTKATGGFDADEANVNGFQILVFDKGSGILESYGQNTGSTCSMAVTTGVKRIYAVVNAPSLSSVGSESQFLSSLSRLDQNAFDGFVMMSPSDSNADKVITTDCSISLPVKRFAAKILLERISAAFTTAALQAEDFIVQKIYLADVVGEASYGLSSVPALFYSGSSDNGSVINGFIREVGLSYNLKNSGYTDVRHGFYVYPNSTSTRTKLVIEARILSANHVYSFELPDIERNKVYDITDVTITRLSGESAAVDFTVSVDDWDATVTDSYVH